MKFIAFAISILVSAAAVAQASPSNSAEPWTPAKSIGMYAYPKNQQNADQQLKDESECYGSAKQQSGVDPQASAPAEPSASEQKAAQEQAAQEAGKSTPKGGAAKGTAGGAAGGAAIGAIAGDAGKGAAIGATTGAVAGRRQQKKAEKEAKTKADHLRLAAYYRLEAEQDQKKLADAEDTMNHYSWMATWTKLPNAYSSSKTNVDIYRSKLEKANRLAGEHEKLAETLQASR